MTDGNNMESPNQNCQPGNGATNGLPDTPDPVAEDSSGGASAPVNTDHPMPSVDDTVSQDHEDEAKPAPEPSLTDHLNKSLLTSFLDRLNDPNMSNKFPEVQRIDTSSDPEDALEIPDTNK